MTDKRPSFGVSEIATGKKRSTAWRTLSFGLDIVLAIVFPPWWIYVAWKAWKMAKATGESIGKTKDIIDHPHRRLPDETSR